MSADQVVCFCCPDLEIKDLSEKLEHYCGRDKHLIWGFNELRFQPEDCPRRLEK